jgi:phosphinothricin acetyltransferase
VWREREAYAGTVETGVYVDPSFHRRGVGRALYAELFTRLRAAGFHTVIAGIALPNDASVRMHEASGFAHVGTCREVGRKFGQWWDVGFWQAPLA